MRNTIIILLLSIVLMSFIDNGYDNAMSTSMEQLREASTKENFREVANRFDRIAAKEKDKWLPYYYAAYVKIILATTEKNPSIKDNTLDEAQATINLVKNIDHDKVEVLTLEAFINMIRISVDPANRGQEYSMKSAAFLEEAEGIEANNHRTMLFMAHLQYGSLQFFNTDTTPACEKFIQALKIFNDDQAVNDPFWPAWGKDQALSMVKQCGG